MKEQGNRRPGGRHCRDAKMQSVLAKRSQPFLAPHCSIDIVMLGGRDRAICRQENYANLPLLNGTLGNLLHVLPLLDHQHTSLRM